jgi:hypothetical protein
MTSHVHNSDHTRTINTVLATVPYTGWHMEKLREAFAPATVYQVNKDDTEGITVVLQDADVAVAKMIELEGNKKLLFSDNYFVQIPGARKRVQITLLEDTNDENLMLTASSMDNPNVQHIALH